MIDLEFSLDFILVIFSFYSRIIIFFFLEGSWREIHEIQLLGRLLVKTVFRELTCSSNPIQSNVIRL